MRTNSISWVCAFVVLGCGDDATPAPDAGRERDGGTVVDDDGGTTPDGGRVRDAGMMGMDAGPPPGDPCAEGPIGVACICEGALHETGFCCSDRWFDGYYTEIIDACPAANAYRFVDPMHASASDANPGTEEMPWETIEHGVATIAAGQVLIVRAGTYAVAGKSSRLDPALNPANSGTEGAPIIIKGEGHVIVTSAPVHTGTARGGTPSTIILAADASSEDQFYYRGWVRIVGGTGAGQSRIILRDFADAGGILSYEGATRTIWVSLTADGANDWTTTPDATSQYEVLRAGPLIGTLSRQHVVWDGFHVVERDSYQPDTGSVVLWDSQDVALLDCDVEAESVLLIDNHNAVRVNGTTRAVIRNNRIHGVIPMDLFDMNNPQNHAGIMIYESRDLRIEHNEIYDSYVGIFPKGRIGGHVIRYNLVHHTDKAFRFSYHADLQVYGNVVRDSGLAFQGAENNDSIRIFNNTIVSTTSGLYNWFAIDSIDCFNNLFSGVDHPAHLEAEPGNFTMHHNAFYDIDDFVLRSADVGGFAAWQALGYDEGSMMVDAPFVDAAAGDYRLVDGSQARMVGRDFEDLDGDGDTTETISAGAYALGTEVVGLRP